MTTPTAEEVAALIARIYNVDPYLKDAFPNAYIALSEAASALAAQAHENSEMRRTFGSHPLFAELEARAAKAEAALRQAVPRERAAQILGELAGSASLCWNPKPTGEFDSNLASKFVDDALAAMYDAARAALEKP